MGQTQVSNGGIQPTILEPIQNLYTGSTIVFTVTVASKDSTHRYNGQGSSNGYKIDGKFAPFIVLTPGITYKFDQADNSNSGHPLRFYKDAAKVTAYTTNVTTNGTAGSSGAYTQIVTGDATPTILYYQCSAHGFMGNAVQTNGLASSVPDDGSITTAKLADDAVTDAKLANSINSAIAANTAKSTNATHTGDVTGSTSLTIANNAVTTAKINDQAVTTGKLANNAVDYGKLADGAVLTSKIADGNVTAAKLASGVQTTINNNANDRVMTGSSGANTLEGEANFTFNGTAASITGGLSINGAGNNNASGQDAALYVTTDVNDWGAIFQKTTEYGVKIDSPNGATLAFALYNGVTQKLAIAGDGKITATNNLAFASGKGIDFSATSNSGTSELFDDYEEGSWTPYLNFSGTNNAATMNIQQGMYRKIGTMIFAAYAIRSTNFNSSTGAVRVAGLPYTSTNTPMANISNSGVFPITGVSFTGEFISQQLSGSTIELYGVSKNSSGNVYSSISVTEMNQTGEMFLKGQIFYNTP